MEEESTPTGVTGDEALQDYERFTYFKERCTEQATAQNAAFDKAVLVTSAGGFALSLTILGLVASAGGPLEMTWAVTSWIAFAAATVAVIATFYLTTSEANRSIAWADGALLAASEHRTVPEQSRYRLRPLNDSLRWVSGLGLILGLGSLGIFATTSAAALDQTAAVTSQGGEKTGDGQRWDKKLTPPPRKPVPSRPAPELVIEPPARKSK